MEKATYVFLLRIFGKSASHDRVLKIIGEIERFKESSQTTNQLMIVSATDKQQSTHTSVQFLNAVQPPILSSLWLLPLE